MFAAFHGLQSLINSYPTDFAQGTYRLAIIIDSPYISVMTEITENTEIPDKLPAAIEAFVLQWGDMGNNWGVNRSISQIHALLYLADDPMTADEVAETLDLARSNVSTSIKELLSWNLIRRVPVRGDRRDHFEAETDVWEIATRIAAGRKVREIDPALATLRSCVSKAEDDESISPARQQKLKAMLEFTESVERWHTQILSLPKSKRSALLKLGAKISSFLSKDDRD